MLKIRIIPTLLWKQFGLVKGVGFNSWRRVGPVLPALRVYTQRDVDELILLDVDASCKGGLPDNESIQDFSLHCNVPLTVGGGIANINHAAQLFRSGADKICINTSAYLMPELIPEIVDKYGSQAVVASVDVKKEGKFWECFSHAGTINTGKCPKVWVKELRDKGVGEILLTSIDRDGTMSGYDLNLIKEVVDIIDVPVIASGGAGNYGHMISAVREAGASAVAAASMFHFTEQTPAGARSALALSGIPVRTEFKEKFE